MTIAMHLRRFPAEGQLRKTYCGRQTSTKLASTNNVLRVTCKVCLREAREHEEQDKTRSKAAVWLQQSQILEILADAKRHTYAELAKRLGTTKGAVIALVQRMDEAWDVRPDAVAVWRPFHGFFFAVSKPVADLTKEEAERECESAEDYFQSCHDIGQGINSKEFVRYRRTAERLLLLGVERQLWSGQR